jgi:predicted nucleic acid-binding protein
MRKFSKVCVDSCVFLSTFLDGECHREQSLLFFQSLNDRSIRISLPILVLMETLQSFFRKTKDGPGTRALFDYLMELNMDKILMITPLEAQFLLHFSDSHMDFDCKTSDAVIAMHAQKESIPLVTWDKALIRACEGKVEAVTPEDFVERLKD